MSQSVPPPGNPFAQNSTPADGPTAPQGVPAPPPAQARVGLGIVAGLAAALVGALAYGGLMRAMAEEDGSYTELGIVALLVGALVGFALGKAGGAHPVLPVAGVPLALAGVFLGQLFGYALMISWWAELQNQSLSVVDIFTSEFGNLLDAWKEETSAISLLFFAIAGYEGFAITRKVAAR
ncbi:hypothetical protein ACF1G0_23880 [Streptomyces sp. NPDC013953]|uniref:hypothetical protein n=1 Tax=Streptomyces sp. NPDC013953 TaxID=3364868 RepID=UPI0036F73968